MGRAYGNMQRMRKKTRERERERGDIGKATEEKPSATAINTSEGRGRQLKCLKLSSLLMPRHDLHEFAIINSH